ncbi:MAG: zinc ribbon domain-containing protein [Lachnospiraceae bacterium]|jgi:hypothetical protein
MARSATQTKIYPYSMDYILSRIRTIDAAGFNFSLQSENHTETGVWFRIIHGMSFQSYGEKITVTLTPVVGGVSVNVHSECGLPTQWVDGGKNQSNVDLIFKYIESGGGATMAAQTQQYQAYTQPAQQPVQQPSYTRPAQQPAAGHAFCGRCGTKLSPGTRFCPRCGTPAR